MTEPTPQPSDPQATDSEPTDPQDQPIAGGDDDSPPAQGEGAQDSY